MRRLSACSTELAQLQAETKKLESDLKELPEPRRVFAIATEMYPPMIRVQRRGYPEDEGEEAVPGAFAWAKHAPANFGDNTLPESQRRLALADWIIHPDNPLTRRVLANRLWHHHFGQGLVNTPSDFGYGGDRPSHPELLDWLANEITRSAWSLKQLHKTIMLSTTYRQGSEFVPSNASVDGSNRLLWRQNPRRLDAESLRDAVLLVTGKLNLQMGGPGFRDFQYTEAYAPIYEYVIAESPKLCCRSIYRFIVRTTPHQFLTTFDCPDPANLTPARVATTTPLQSLALNNNEFMLRQAEHLAARVTSEASHPKDRILKAFQLAFQRHPTELESAAAEKLLEQQGLFALCRALLNANEFLYLD
jgi:hypothetical protein